MNKCERGFTLLEMLLVLIIYLSIAFLFPLIIQVFEKWTNEKTILHPFEWEVATRQLSIEIREAKKMVISDNTIELITTSGNSVTYKMYNQALLRQVNNKGHEIVLQNIRNFQVVDEEYSIRIDVTDLSDETYHVSIYRWLDVINRE
ncbi:competence type IV pilus minor pilin ComGF [Bacillus salitolerans]|uniref:Competence type IV pilus minor pilin ComGF n=1 Tax=Bacillus salitolerans TaxID=1437434 RepID=A0ABW4LQX2_9BACI